MTDRRCRFCHHPRHAHRPACGGMESTNPEDPFVPGARWLICQCEAFIDPYVPLPGERLEFGRHRIPEAEAETAPAWPSLAKFGAAIRRRSLGR